MAKSKEDLLDQLYASLKHCTLEDLERVLSAYGFELRKSGRDKNVRVWRKQGQIVVMHRPHGNFAKAGAVTEVIGVIERAEEIRKSGNGKPKDGE